MRFHVGQDGIRLYLLFVLAMVSEAKISSSVLVFVSVSLGFPSVLLNSVLVACSYFSHSALLIYEPYRRGCLRRAEASCLDLSLSVSLHPVPVL